jgi:hypothetical protein
MPAIIGYEDASTPTTQVKPHAPGSVPQTTISPNQEDQSLKIAASLDDTRGEGPPRRVGFWQAGTGSVFDPSRWIGEDGKFDDNRGPSMPFGLGPRGCFSKKLAVSYSLFSLLFLPGGVLMTNCTTDDGVEDILRSDQSCVLLRKA